MHRSLASIALGAALGLAAAPSAQARHWHHHGPYAGFEFRFGGPLYYDPWPWGAWSPPYWYEPRTVIVEREPPPVYIQRQPPPAGPAFTPWYYCPSPAGYYPHVPSCGAQWVPVDPSTLPPSR
jgi:hypothetical protein